MIRHLVALMFILIFTSPSMAVDLGNMFDTPKSNSHIGQNPGTPDGREGGEDISTAFLIPALPFHDTGNTSDNLDDYDVECPYGGMAKDVIYSYVPPTNEYVNVDLCGSSFDTKTYILDGAFNVIACNDDYYSDDECGSYVSFIEAAFLEESVQYFIAVDGYGSHSGDYILDITVFTPPPPCFLTCDGLPEGEPALGPNYSDAFNGGCNSPEYGNPFADLTQAGDAAGELVYCGSSGWYSVNNSPVRDTDWMHFMVGAAGLIQWTLDAEHPVFGFLLGGDCESGAVIQDQITAGPCLPATLMVQGEPGDIVMLWVGPTEYSPPFGFVGHEFNYVGHFTGLASGTVPTDNFSFGAVKSMYR